MSIEKGVVPFSRSFRTLISIATRTTKSIKDLKALKALQIAACYRHAGPKGPEEGRDVMFTVARGPVPRERSMAATRPQALALR